MKKSAFYFTMVAFLAISCSEDGTFENLPNHPDPDPDEAMEENKIPALLRFVGGEVNMTNMKSLQDLPGISQTSIWTVVFTDYTSDFTPEKKYIRVKIDGVSVDVFQ